MENVPGLGLSKHSLLLQQLINGFKAAGYEITEPVQVLNAAEFGVPQRRQRLFLLGARIGTTALAYPEPELRSHSQYVTVRDAIADLPNLDDFAELHNTDCVQLTPRQMHLIQALAMPYVEKLRNLISDPGNFAYSRQWNPQLLTCSIRTQHTETSIQRFQETPPGKLEPISRLRRLNWDTLCYTLRAGTGYERGSYTSPREAARLHSFPDWFRFHMTKWHGFRQVGNAVPPLLARVLGRQIIAALQVEPSVPTTPLELRDTQLLRFKLLQASQYWKAKKNQ
jgi:DNA (cytosine-5)-methyltransferase 1